MDYRIYRWTSGLPVITEWFSGGIERERGIVDKISERVFALENGKRKEERERG